MSPHCNSASACNRAGLSLANSVLAGSPPAMQKRHFNAIPMSSSTNDVCFDEFSAPVNLSVTVLPT